MNSDEFATTARRFAPLAIIFGALVGAIQGIFAPPNLGPLVQRAPMLELLLLPWILTAGVVIISRNKDVRVTTGSDLIWNAAVADLLSVGIVELLIHAGNSQLRPSASLFLSLGFAGAAATLLLRRRG